MGLEPVRLEDFWWLSRSIRLLVRTAQQDLSGNGNVHSNHAGTIFTRRARSFH
jgi:hypothetical protein